MSDFPVNQGDFVVRVADGITVFSPEIAAGFLLATRRQQFKEVEMLKTIANGTYRGLIRSGFPISAIHDVVASIAVRAPEAKSLRCWVYGVFYSCMEFP
ncbi:MAG: hypothetical protein ABJ360_04970 [Roseobacter sp.]